MDILKFTRDPGLLGNVFAGKSWSAWRTILKAVYGLPMTAAERALHAQLTGRLEPPTSPATEAYVVAGRRGGKTTTAAGVALHKAVERDYRPFLPPGGIATIPIIAPDHAQAGIMFNTVRGMTAQSTVLKNEVARDTNMSLRFKFGVEVKVMTASSKAVRGYTCPCVILDELCFFAQGAEAADADEEIVRALLPSLATIPHSLLLGISSPYARRGVMWEKYERNWGQPNDSIQVFRAPTKTLNPNIPQSIIDEALERDYAAASAEWLAQWRQDRDSYVSREIVQQCTDKGVLERPLVPGTKYYGYVDPAGGAGEDSFCLAIGHADVKKGSVLDLTLTRKPPFNAESVVQEMAMWCKKFGILRVTGDHFSGDVIRSLFQKCGITYQIHGAPKREIYRSFLPMLTSGKVALTDNPVLHNQLVSLERSVSRGGLETITHPLGGHDDVAVAAAGVLVTIAEKASLQTAMAVAPIVVDSMPTDGAGHRYDYGSGSGYSTGGIVYNPDEYNGGSSGVAVIG